MIRDVLDLMKDEKDAELRLVVPHDLHVDDARQSGRFTHRASDDDKELEEPPSPQRAAW